MTLTAERSDIDEILSSRPSWLVLRGTAVIALVLLSILVMAWFIRYPDVVRAPAVVTSPNAPVSLVVRSAGRITLLVREDERVAAEQYVAVVENPARVADVRRLKAALENADVADPSLALDAKLLAQPLVLGALEVDYSRFVTAWTILRSVSDPAYRDAHRGALQTEVRYREEIAVALQRQMALLEDELRTLEAQLARTRRLHDDGLLSASDLERSRAAVLAERQMLEKEHVTALGNTIQLVTLRRALLDQSHADERGRLEALLAFREAHRTLLAAIREWEVRWVLIAPHAGQVSFFKVWRSDEFVNAGEEAMTIVPSSSLIVGKAFLPQARSGKVKPGQRVLIKLDDYPSDEFGTLRGTVTSVAPVAREQQYAVTLALPDGLTTSYRKSLDYRPELRGTAEIVTNDRRLLERLFDQLRSAVHRQETP